MKTYISLVAIVGMLSAAKACTVQVRDVNLSGEPSGGLTQANCGADCGSQFEADATAHVDGVDRKFQSAFSASTYFYDTIYHAFTSSGERYLCAPEFAQKYDCYVYYDAGRGNGPQRVC